MSDWVVGCLPEEHLPLKSVGTACRIGCFASELSEIYSPIVWAPNMLLGDVLAGSCGDALAGSLGSPGNWVSRPAPGGTLAKF